MTGTYNNNLEDNQTSNSSKGDISQQIMETHGQRVKKYGIYIDQLVEKIKIIQNDSQDLTDAIGYQTSQLIKI